MDIRIEPWAIALAIFAVCALLAGFVTCVALDLRDRRRRRWQQRLDLAVGRRDDIGYSSRGELVPYPKEGHRKEVGRHETV